MPLETENNVTMNGVNSNKSIMGVKDCKKIGLTLQFLMIQYFVEFRLAKAMTV